MGCLGGGPVKVPQLARALQLGEIPLAQHLKGANGHGVCQVQAAEAPQHGDAHARLWVLEQELLRQPGGFLPEEQVAAVGVGDVRVAALGLGGEKEKAALVFFEKFGKAFIGGKREIGPVVQPGVAQLFVFQLKAHGPHQVQGRAGDGAGAGDIPRVLGDFRLY